MKNKLYVKNEKGRYEPYQPPTPPHENGFYIKVGKQYKPLGICMPADSLTEGVWVVTKNQYGMNYANGKYLQDSFLCMKASDILEAPTLAELGGYEKLAAYLVSNWDKVDKRCVNDMAHSIVGILMKYKENKK